MMGENMERLSVAFAKANETMRKAWGRDYPERIKTPITFVQSAMDRHRCSPLEAPYLIVKDAKARGVSVDDLWLAALMAAAVDLLERRPCAGAA